MMMWRRFYTKHRIMRLKRRIIFILTAWKGIDRLTRNWPDYRGGGDISKKEARGIIETAKSLKMTLLPLKDKPLARRLYSYFPQVRGRFFMQNADSFSQIIMELADRIETKTKRDTSPGKRLNTEVLTLFITRVLWQTGAVGAEGGDAPVTVSPRAVVSVGGTELFRAAPVFQPRLKRRWSDRFVGHSNIFPAQAGAAWQYS